MKEKFPVTGQARTYNFLYPHVAFFTRRFYKEFKVIGFDKIPRDRSIILAPNHQNAFMDAIVLLIPAGWKWQLSYLVRASIFQSKPARKFFNNINMLPVYRKDVDGTASLEKNDEIFDNCVYLLSNHKPLVLYPEATHNLKRKLIPLKKGITRIAFAAEEKNNYELSILIFPVGIYYTNPRNFNERVLIQVADPITLSDYRELYSTNPAKAQLQIKFELEKRLREIMIDIKNDQYYDEIDFLRLIDANTKELIGLEEEFKNSKKVIAAVEEYIHQNESGFKEVAEQVNSYKQTLELLDLRDRVFTPQFKPIPDLNYILPLLLTLPFYIFGAIHHVIPFLLPLWVIKKFIKDPGFHSSIKVALGMFFIGVFHFIFFMIFWSVSDSFWLTLVYFFSLLITGEIALWWQAKFNSFRAQLRWKKIIKTTSYSAIMKQRENLTRFLASIVK